MDLARKVYYTLKSIGEHPLNRRAKTRAITRFIVSQIAVRLVPGDIGVPFPNETKLLIHPLMKGAAHFISPGLCEFDEMCFVVHYLRAGDLFADVGANVGAYMLLASGVAGATTVAFEPSPSTFRYLKDNVKLNTLTEKVALKNAAVGRQEGRLRLTENLGTENYVCPNDASISAIEVAVTTLDSAFSNAPPLLIKVDVEGFETDVFAGATRILTEPGLHAMIVERAGNAVRYGYDESKLHERIRSAGFTPCGYSAMNRQLSKIGPESQGNIIYVRNFEDAQKRLRMAAPFRFAGREI
jgi:FkbM family methyltransferase